MRTPGRMVFLALTLACASALLLAACGSQTNAAAPAEAQGGGSGGGGKAGGSGGGQKVEVAATEVGVAPVVVRPVERTITVTGTLYGEEETAISTKLSGRVERIMADVGDRLMPAAPLAQLERRDYELALTERRAAVQAALARIGLTELPSEAFDPSQVPTVIRARAEAANAEAKYNRARQLFEQSPPLISEQDFSDIRTSQEVASSSADVELLTAGAVLAEARTREAEAAAAAQRLADTTIRVPGMEGEESPVYEVAERLVSEGEYLPEGRMVYRLVASGVIKFRADVPERFVGQVQTGQEAAVWVEAYAEPVTGTVARVSPRIDPQNRMFRVEIHIPNSDGRLKPGGFAQGQIVTRIEDGVTFVPEAAVVTFAGVQKVYSISDGKAVEHRVQTGVREDGMVEIVGGLAAEEVVVRGAAGLSGGVPVRATGE